MQLGLDDQYKRLNEVRGKERLPNTQVSIIIIPRFDEVCPKIFVAMKLYEYDMNKYFYLNICHSMIVWNCQKVNTRKSAPKPLPRLPNMPKEL